MKSYSHFSKTFIASTLFNTYQGKSGFMCILANGI